MISRKYHDKEIFVTGHSGTTVHEIFLISLVIPASLILYRKLDAWWCNDYDSTVRCDNDAAVIARKPSTVRAILLEFVILCMPMLVVQTSILPDFVGPLGLSLGMIILAQMIPSSSELVTITTSSARNEQPQKPHPHDQKYRRIRPACLSIHRACVYLLTTVAILAVDFPIFPRRFCKTEVSGYGWMDLGAASFIIIAGWVSALSNDGLATTNNNTRTTIGRSLIRKALLKCIPLLLLGLIRLATNKGLEYQEHVSEYGVHWNFFFSLCLVEGSMVAWKGLKTKFSNATKRTPLDCILAISIMTLYQVFLSQYGGQTFIEEGSRRCTEVDSGNILPAWFISNHSFMCNIFVANREGILGVLGYLNLRLFSEAIARQCLLPIQERSDRQHQARLFFMSASLWFCHFGLTLGFKIPNSRRSTNVSFVLWALSHNMILLSLIYVANRQRANAKNDGMHYGVPQILEAVNRFGLAVFLSSNVVTGLVNLTFDTLHTSNGMAMLILTTYLLLVCGFAIFLNAVKWGSTLKVR